MFSRLLIIILTMLLFVFGDAGRVVPRTGPPLRLSSLIQPDVDESSAQHVVSAEACEIGCRRYDPGRAGVCAADMESMALKVVSVNATAWSTAREFLGTCDAQVVLLQEHKLVSDTDIKKADNWAASQGWSSIWHAASKGKSEGASSGGVAILARRGIGLRKVALETVHTARAVAGIIEVPGCPPMSAKKRFFQAWAGHDWCRFVTAF